MKRTMLLVLSLAAFTALSGRGDTTNRLHLPGAGFSIAPLEAPPGVFTGQALTMFLPTAQGFAANVGVQIQPYEGTIDDYLALSLEQFKSMNMKVLQRKRPSKTVVVFEYSGDLQGRTLHWYARAEKAPGAVYLVTATADDDQWNKVAPRLKACVDSFGRDPGHQPTAPAVQPRR